VNRDKICGESRKKLRTFRKDCRLPESFLRKPAKPLRNRSQQGFHRAPNAPRRRPFASLPESKGRASMVQSRWQVEEDYRYLEGADRAGIAWEFLRRNAGYQDAMRRSVSPAIIRCGTFDLLDGGATALRWGLLFRRRT
jgi:hypothetical protein